MPDNIFRRALELLSTKSGYEMTNLEAQLVATAIVPLLLRPEYSDIPICQGLQALSDLLECKARDK